MDGVISMKKKLLFALLVLALGYPFAGYSADPLANLPDPTRHKQKQKKAVKQVKQKSLILQSTLISDERSYAIINGESVAIGERIGGATLLTITPFEVVLLRHGQKRTLPLATTRIVREDNPEINDD